MALICTQHQPTIVIIGVLYIISNRGGGRGTRDSGNRYVVRITSSCGELCPIRAIHCNSRYSKYIILDWKLPLYNGNFHCENLYFHSISTASILLLHSTSSSILQTFILPFYTTLSSACTTTAKATVVIGCTHQTPGLTIYTIHSPVPRFLHLTLSWVHVFGGLNVLHTC